MIPVQGSGRTFKFAFALTQLDWSGFDVVHAHTDDYWLWRLPVPAHVRTIHGSCFDEAIHIHGARERGRMLLLGLSEILATVACDEAVGVWHATLRWTPWVRRVIPNGVDLTRFHPGDRAEVPTGLFVGTYERRKRGKLLMEIFRREVRPLVPEARLWMVAEDAPSANGITVFGRVSDSELADLYQRVAVVAAS